MLQTVHFDQPAEAELACRLVDSVITPDNQALQQLLMDQLCSGAEPQLAMRQLQHRCKHLSQATEVYEALLVRLLSMKGLLRMVQSPKAACLFAQYCLQYFRLP